MLNLPSIKNVSNQNGYMWLFLAAAVVAALVFLMPAKYSAPAGNFGGDDNCLETPRITNNNFQDEGETFELIKKQAPVVIAQREAHLAEGKKLIVNGQERLVQKVIRNITGVLSIWKTFDDSDEVWENLRFVDVTDTINSRAPGTAYLDIYAKRGGDIPRYITEFCASNPTQNISFFSDNEDNSFPPKEIDAATINNWHCNPPSDPAQGQICQMFSGAQLPRTGKYYLYAYDTDGVEVVKDRKRKGDMPIGDVSINGSTYPIVFYGGFESKHLRLEVNDPRFGGSIGFRYTTAAKLRVADDPYKNLNTQKTATSSLKLEAFTPWLIPPAGWWTPECKPAIYLYPKNEQLVNVKVTPKGFFTYTDPVYNDKTGWNVKAYPSGKLEWLDNLVGLNSKGETRPTNIYDYLYYESKIHDSEIEKPTKGYVVAFKDLEKFYSTTLPELGLNDKETNDYVNYWKNVLPKADYYFIGLLSDENVSSIEPLTITPNPDSLLRVRLYYEALSKEEASQKMKSVVAPLIEKDFTRNGFSVVEWGGMVKQDKNHPFTCSI